MYTPLTNKQTVESADLAVSVEESVSTSCDSGIDIFQSDPFSYATAVKVISSPKTTEYAASLSSKQPFTGHKLTKCVEKDKVTPFPVAESAEPDEGHMDESQRTTQELAGPFKVKFVLHREGLDIAAMPKTIKYSAARDWQFDTGDWGDDLSDDLEFLKYPPQFSDDR
jgi:hypothetical protein